MTGKIGHYVSAWRRRGYPIDIPDEVPGQLMQLGLAPSYRAIVIAILKNDHALQSLGYSPSSSRWYYELKRIELAARGVPIAKRSTVRQLAFPWGRSGHRMTL